MKMNKTICLDPEIIKKINDNGVNASNLINELLIAHFKIVGTDNLSKKEKLELLKKEREILLQKEKLEEMQNDQK